MANLQRIIADLDEELRSIDELVASLSTVVCSGASAQEWMSIAPAYAGPPGSGRRPGQFAEEGG
jgi:hypothetical protein